MRPVLENLKREIAAMRRDSEASKSKPHKLVLLLAVLELAERDLLDENKIYYDQRLRELFAKYFDAIAEHRDWCQPSLPFFHLRSSNFWHHKMKEGFESKIGAIDAKTGKPTRQLSNIEFAYLSDEAFTLINDVSYRRNLRDFIVAMFPPEQSERIRAMIQPSATKLGTAFHETFPLDRARLTSILETVAAHAGDGTKLTYDDFKERSGLGANQVKSFRRYAQGTGLIDKNERLTEFGSLVAEQDPQISKPATQWMMHYYMVAPHHSGPMFWHHLSTKVLVEGAELTRDSVGQSIKEFLAAQGERALAEETYPKTATVFLGSYEKGGGFEALEILRAEAGKYRVGQPRPIPAGAFACLLADYWAARWGEKREALLSDLAGGELAALLLLSSGEVNALLGELSERGLLHRQRRTPPFQVIRHWDDPASLWREQLYAEGTR
jgi:hypothetical protein